MSEREPGWKPKAVWANSENVRMPRSVSSAPRGLDVVPLVNTIIAVSSSLRGGRSNTLSSPMSSAARARAISSSALWEPNPPTTRPGSRRSTSRAFST